MASIITKLSSDAIPCDGPLMYSPNHFITPDGKLFKFLSASKRYVEIKAVTNNKVKTYSWGGAMKLHPDGTTTKMEAINGFYITNKGGSRVNQNALIAYYFVEKLQNPEGMRAMIIDKTIPIHQNNVRWGTKQEQINVRMLFNRSIVNPTNIRKCVDHDDIDTSDYTEFKGFLIKNDGERILTELADGFKEISIRTSSDGYRNATLHINGNIMTHRMNRLMATIHHNGGNLIGEELVVDHKDGNITNNHPDNLEIVSNIENVRRGKSSKCFYQVDPTTHRIVAEHKCVKAFAEKNEGFRARTLYRHFDTGKIYNEFLWYDASMENICYSITDGVIGRCRKQSG